MKKLLLLCFGGLMFGASAGEISVEGSHAVTSAENNSGTIFFLQDGSTLEIPASLGTSVVLKARVKVAENARAKLSVATGVISVRMEGGLYALSDASLSVRGIGVLSIGQPGSETSISTTPLEIAQLTFEDAQAQGLVLTNCVTVRQMPIACPVSVAAGATLALLGKDTLKPLGVAGDFSLNEFDLVILDSAAVSSNVTVTVASGRTLAVKPCVRNGDWAWAGKTDSNFYLPSVVLGGTGSRLLFRNGTMVEYKSCPVSGAGDVVFKPDTATKANTPLLYGPFDYTGEFVVGNASSVSTATSAWQGGTTVLSLSDGAVFRANGASTFAGLAISGSARIDLLFNSEMTVGDVVSGDGLTVSYNTSGGGKVNFVGGFPAPFELTSVGPAYCLFNGGDAVSGLACRTPTGMTYLWPDATGALDCSRLPPLDEASSATAGEDVRVLSNVPSTLPVTARGDVKVVARDPSAKIRAEAGGTVAYEMDQTSWQTSVKLWIDPSTATFGPVGGVATNAATLNGNAVFASLADKRAEQTTYALLNKRDITAKKESVNWQVYPLAVAGACNGLTVFSCGGYQQTGSQTYVFADGSPDYTSSATQARRILVARNGDVSATAPEAAGAVVMVFGSQNGGGAALVGTKNGAFCRTGTTLDAPITTNTAHRIFVNGRQVADPSTEKLSGGWDVVTVELDGALLSAFGWGGADGNNNDYQHCGGQQYGEIIVFSSVPTDSERIAAERYLAKKWGLAQKYTRLSDDVELSGAGMVSVGDQVLDVTGRFTGMVGLSGGTLKVGPSGTPDSGTVPTGSMLAWFDPDSEDAMLLNRDTEYPDAKTMPDKIWALYDKLRPGRADGDFFLFGVSARRPLRVREARGDGPVRNWIHFNTEDNMRFLQLPLPDLSSTTVSAVPLPNVREVFVVQDSSRGGGTPVIDKINANVSISGMKILPRRTADAASPIWASANGSTYTDAVITGGVTRLNGAIVDGRSRGFTGGVEIFSFSTTDNYSPIAFADLWNASVAGKDAYEMMGEILVYGSVLSNGDRTKVIDYLNGKWRGVLPVGRADLSRATVTGEGTVKVERLSEAPILDAAFDGFLTASKSGDRTFVVTPTLNHVDGAIVAPQTVLDLPATATVTVMVEGRRSAEHGTFELIDCKAFVCPTEWTLDLRARPGINGNLRVEGGKLLLELSGNGMAIIVR